MTISKADDRGSRRTRIFLCGGVALLVVGVIFHEWTLRYLLQPGPPFRLTARVHWWFISLNAWCVGLWLILARHSIRAIAVAAVLVSYALLGFLLVTVDLWRAYMALTDLDHRNVIGEYQILDSNLGWTLKPNGKARVVREGVYNVLYEIDAEGFRRTIPDAEARRRIIVLGDSFAFGWGVNDDETLPSRLAVHQLGQAKIVNAGVEGHGITQIYARFLHSVQGHVQPGDVVIFAFIEDDIGRNWPDFVFVSQMLFGPKPIQWFPVFENDEIRIQETDTYANRVKALLVHAPWMGSFFVPVLLPQTKRAIEDAQRMIEKVRDAVEARGARFMLVQLPTGGELRKNPATLDHARFGALQVGKHFPKDRESFEAYFLSKDDGHYSPKGHSLVAQIIQDELVAQGWISR